MKIEEEIRKLRELEREIGETLIRLNSSNEVTLQGNQDYINLRQLLKERKRIFVEMNDKNKYIKEILNRLNKQIDDKENRLNKQVDDNKE